MSPDLEGSQAFSDTACTEAAGWVTRLHGPQRTPAAEAGFRRWLCEGPENARAFEFMTEVWETSGRLRRRPLEQVKSWQLPGMRISLSRAALVGSAIAVVAVLGTLFAIHSTGFSTGIGEQRTLVLEDGSRVYLNTDSQAKVRFDSSQRLIELRKGEALFEVAREPGRPFIVLAGDRRVKALGTTFVVRRDAEQIAVTLVEGKIAVSTAEGTQMRERAERPRLLTGAVSQPTKPIQPHEDRDSSEVITLTPGQRLTLAENRPIKVDTPRLSKLIAWQRGQVDLDGMRLGEAVTEMNRYSHKLIVIEDARAAELRISGLFVAADTENFVQAVAFNYGLEIRRSPDEIRLTGSGK